MESTANLLSGSHNFLSVSEGPCGGYFFVSTAASCPYLPQRSRGRSLLSVLALFSDTRAAFINDVAAISARLTSRFFRETSRPR